MGRDGGLVVSVLDFYSDDLNLNHAAYLNFQYETTKINEKEAGVGPPLKELWELRDSNPGCLLRSSYVAYFFAMPSPGTSRLN